jgi:hypothetical protein
LRQFNFDHFDLRVCGRLGKSVRVKTAVTPAASGAVEFFDGSVSLGSVAVAAGSAQVTFSNCTEFRDSLPMSTAAGSSGKSTA